LAASFVSAFLSSNLPMLEKNKLKSAPSGTQSRVPDFMPNIASSSQILQVEHIKGNVWCDIIREEIFPSTSNYA
jgi:hypothetical protein